MSTSEKLTEREIECVKIGVSETIRYMSETKQEVFDALLFEIRVFFGSYDLDTWRERYEKAERFGRSHDVDDLYVVAPKDEV